MVNNQEFFCNHCRRNTTFYLESDLLWYCDECGNVLHSIPDEIEEDDDEYFMDEMEQEVIKCPFCNNLIAEDELEDGYLCPICYEDLSGKIDEIEDDGE